MAIENFIGKMRRSEGLLRAMQKGTTGQKSDEIHQKIVKLRGLRQGAEDSVKPCAAGFGCTGEATIRAAHGGTLDPGYRSNR